MPKIIAAQIARLAVQHGRTEAEVREAVCVGLREARNAGYEDGDLLLSEVVACLEREAAAADNELRAEFLRRSLSVVRELESTTPSERCPDPRLLSPQ